MALLFAVLHIAASALPQSREAASKEISIDVVVHSPVTLTLTERRKVKAVIRELG